MGVKISAIVGILMIALTGCGMGPKWDYRMWGVSYHHHIYRVTHTVLSTVGSEIGGVTYHGRISGFFKFYAVPGHPTRAEIAVQAQQGFLKAVAVPPRHKK